MASLSLKTKIFLHPNNPSLQFHSQGELQSIKFPKKVKLKIKVSCSAKDQPQQQRKYTKKKRSVSEEEKGVDPVGFLTKLGITHKPFAQFLRERHKAVKDLKNEIFERFLNLMEFASGVFTVGDKSLL